jgi:hypothetical protein
MKKLGILGVMLPMLAAFPQVSNAATPYRFILEEYTGDDSLLYVDIYNINTPTVTFDVYVPTGSPSADIFAVYFNWSPDTLSFPMSPVSGANVTDWDLSGNGSVHVLDDNDTNMHGGGYTYSFDGGVQIGCGGLSCKGTPDDIQHTVFTVTANSNMMIDAVGARLKSVEQVSGNRNGSSKLFSDDGNFVIQAVPEPASAVMIGVGIALVRLTQMRKQYSEV